jgi:AcrR family transcriptional regulator
MIIIIGLVSEAATRDRLLDAAAEVFAERGYEGAALADIARRAGFTTGAIYSRFRNKAELLLEVVRGALEEQQAAAVAATLGADARFADLVAQFVDPDRETSRALVVEAHVAARRDATVGELLRSFQADRLDSLASLVNDAQQAGEVEPGLDPRTAATLFMAIPLGLLLLDAAGVELPAAAEWSQLAGYTAAALAPRQEVA